MINSSKIRRGWRDLSVFKKVLASLSLIFFFNLCLMLVWEKHDISKEEVVRYEQSIWQTELILKDCIRYSNQFIISDVRDTNFFIKKTSQNIIQFDQSIELLWNQVTKLSEANLTGSYQIVNEIVTFKDYLHMMSSNQLALRDLVLNKGFYDFGLEGKLRSHIHIIEDEYSEFIGLADVLELRRIEKDYLLRRQDYYVEKFQFKIAEIINTKKSTVNDSLRLSLKYLKTYNNLFLSLVKTTKQLYDEDQGMLHKLDANAELLVVKLSDLKKVVVANSEERLTMLGYFYWTITIVFIVVSMLLIFFIARELTIPIQRLNKGVKEFIESDFELISYPNYKNRKDELGVLNSNFLKLQKEIGETFKNYRDAAEIKQSKLLRQKEKIEIQKFLITEHRATLQEKNKRLQDSLEYALKIQSNLMLTSEEMKKSALRISSFYKPKDIVSGDFYWYFENEGSIYVALADCTGHGVPGAFLSILGISFLNVAVQELGIVSPNMILEYINNRIIRTLNSEGAHEGLRDSIDMVIVKVEKENEKVTISSANKDFVIVRNNSFERVKNSRCSVGSSGLYNVKSSLFENVEFQAEELDSIFLYSDGIIDQFGVETNKKFKFKRFESILNQSKDIVDTVASVKSAIGEWQGNLEQTDDISLLGIDLKYFTNASRNSKEESVIKSA